MFDDTDACVAPSCKRMEQTIECKRRIGKPRSKIMASNKTMVPVAKAAMEQFKMQAANEVGVNLQNGYNGDLTARQAGSIGGQMVKKMVESYENSIKGNK